MQLSLFEHLDEEEVFLEREVEEGDIKLVTESELRRFFRSPYSYFLGRHKGLTKIPLSGSAALVIHFRNARKGLFNLKDEGGRIMPYQTRAGKDWKMAEDMGAVELAKHLANKSGDAFGGAMWGRWLRVVDRNSFAGRELIWSYDSQPGHRGSQLKTAGQTYYDFVMQNGAPVLGGIDLTTSFQFDGLAFKVKFPELRKGTLTVDDPGLWGFNSYFSEKGIGDINTSSLVTLRLLAYASLAHQFWLFREKLQIPEEMSEGWGGNPNHLDERLVYRHLNCSTGEISETRRTDRQLGFFRKHLDTFLEAEEKQRYPVSRKHCGSCPWNAVDLAGKSVCDLPQTTKPSTPMYYFDPTNYHIEVVNEEGSISLRGSIRHGDMVKEVNRMELEHVLHGGDLVVYSSYESHARGFGFENRMIEEMDRQLSRLSRVMRRNVVHRLHFDRDFKFAGQRSIEELLGVLDYVENQKVYT